MIESDNERVLPSESQPILKKEVFLKKDHPLFDAGFAKIEHPVKVPLHHHDYYEIFYFVSGDVDYLADGQTYHLIPGDLLLFPPEVLHQPLFLSDSEYQRIVLNLDCRFFERYSSGKTDLSLPFQKARQNRSYLIRLTKEDRQVASNILNGLSEEDPKMDFGRDVIQAGMVATLLVQIERFLENGAAFVKARNNMPATIRSLLLYINEHYASDCSLDALEKQFYISKYYLSRQFSEAVGTSVARYVTQKRLAASKRLLLEGIPCHEVYSQVGFENYPTFFRAFKKEYSLSPRDYTQNRLTHLLSAKDPLMNLD